MFHLLIVLWPTWACLRPAVLKVDNILVTENDMERGNGEQLGMFQTNTVGGRVVTKGLIVVVVVRWVL